jgi:microcystin-dependent protein
MKKYVTKNKLHFISFFIIFICLGEVFAVDNVGIGTISPDPSAILDLTSTNKGFLPPRMTTTERNAIGSPATGLIIYNNTNSRYEYNAGTPGTPNWSPIISNGITSVGLSMPSAFSVTGSPLIANGTLTVGWANQALNTVLAGPTSGSAAPTFRALVAGDIPNIDGTKIELASNVNGDLMYYNGTDWVRLGVGTNNQVLSSNGTIPGWSAPPSSLPSGTTDQTLRYSGSAWVANATVFANAAGKLTLGDATTNPGTIDLYDVSGGQKLTLQSANLAANSTYTIPDAGTTANFVMSEGVQTINGAKTLTGVTTFTDNIAIQGTTAKELRIYEPSGSGSDYTGFKAAAMTTGTTLIYTLPTTVGTAGQVLSAFDGAGTLSWVNGASGTVTSVGISLPTTVFTNGSAVTSTGNLSATFNTQTANTIFAGPTTGSAAVPAFRALVLNDIPNIDGTKIELASNVNGDLMYYNGTDWVRLGIGTNNYVLTSIGGIPGWQVLPPSLPSGSANNTLRYDQTGQWIANSSFTVDAAGSLNTSANIKATGTLNIIGTMTTGNLANTGSLVINDGNGQSATISTSDLSASRIYTLPDVGANSFFILNEGSQTINGIKTLTDNIIIKPNTGNTAKQIQFYEDFANGSNYISIQAPSDILTSNYNFTLPGNYGSSNQVLTTNGSGVLTWSTPSGSVPSGTDKQTLRYNGTSLEASGNLTNDGTNIGIGSAVGTAAAKLHQDGGNATATSHKFTAGTTTGQTASDGFDVGIDASGNAVINQNENLNMYFNTNNTERMRIWANGKIGINTAANFNDSLKMWLEGDMLINGDLVVTGNIDPTSLTLIPGSAPAGATKGTIYYDNTANSLKVTDGSTFTEIGSLIKSNIDLKNTDNTAKELKFYEPSTSGNNYTAFKAQPQGGDVTYTLPADKGTTGQVLSTSDNTGTLAWISAGGGGSVTSVGISLPTSVFTNGSAVTTSGNLSATFNTQTANTVFAGPSTGADAVPVFRALVAGDIPNIGASKISSGILPVANGGTNNNTVLTNSIVIGNTAGNGYTNTAAGTTGQILVGNTGAAPSWSNLSALSWGMTGNASTVPSTNYLGTSDAVDLSIRTNATEGIRIIGGATNTGNVGVSESTPSQKLTVKGNILLEPNGATASQLRFAIPSDTTKYTSFKAQTQAATINYTLPAAVGTTGQVLSTSDGSGTLAWANAVPTGAMMMWTIAAAPSGWLLCDGSAVSRTTYAALFALISTTYGTGDGSTTFNVPDLRGRFPLGSDNMGQGSANRVTATQADNLGQGSGAETVTLDGTQIPNHTHTLRAYTGANANSKTPLNNVLGSYTSNPSIYSAVSPDTNMNSSAITSTGGGLSHSNMPPYMTINFIIKY